MNAETVKNHLNIADLDQSARMLSLLNEIYFLQMQVNALIELTKIKFNSYDFDSAFLAEARKPENVNIKNALMECVEAIKMADEDPQARLKAMFKAKMEGKL